MQLTVEQSSDVRQWVKEGLTLSQIQNRLHEKYQLNLTYMDVRMLVDDMDLSVASKPSSLKQEQKQAAAGLDPAGGMGQAHGSVRVSVDKVQRPGAMVSGNVIFSDGKSCQWQLDQMGRLGLIPSEAGYKPSQEDIAQFQHALQEELQRSGF
jgi:hypothetical protein